MNDGGALWLVDNPSIHLSMKPSSIHPSIIHLNKFWWTIVIFCFPAKRNGQHPESGNHRWSCDWKTHQGRNRWGKHSSLYMYCQLVQNSIYDLKHRDYHGCRFRRELEDIPSLFRQGGGSHQCYHPLPTFLYRKFIELRHFKCEVFWPNNIEQIPFFFNYI